MSEETPDDPEPALPQVTNAPTGSDAMEIYGDQFATEAYKPRDIERHVVMAVDVMDRGRVEQAFASLRRRFREEGFDRIVRQRRRIRPCLVRRQKASDAKYRHYKKELAERMKWIHRLRGRGF